MTGIWLGADLGTQSVRVLAVTDDGDIAGSGSRPLDGTRTGERHEQDPEQWWSAFAAAAGDALAAVDRTRVRGIAVDATSGTILLADRSSAPLTPGLMYDDARAAEQATRVDEAGAPVWAALGYQRMQPTWALPKLVWLAENVQQARLPGARLLHQPDLITWRLAGHQVAADASHGLKTGYHLRDLCWPLHVFDALDVPIGLLPDVVLPGSVLGTVCAEAAAQTSIPAGTAIVAGMTDSCAAQLAAGALDDGAWNSVLGTTLVLKGTARHPVHDPDGVVYCHRGPAGSWLPGGASSSGAGALTRLLPGADLDALTAAAARREPDAVTYPLAGSRGERFPIADPGLEPFTLGSPGDDAAVFAAVLLGVACVERLCFDHLDRLGAPIDGRLTFTGGATANRYWSQLRADLLGRPVSLPRHAQSAVGMAVLAAGHADRTPAEAAAAMVRMSGWVEPRDRPALTERYLAFVDHLHDAGHLTGDLARHAHERTTR